MPTPRSVLPLALVLGLVLGIACDEQPEQPKCAVFLECYSACRADRQVGEGWEPDGADRCDPANYPDDGSEPAEAHAQCFDDCGGWELDVDPRAAYLIVFPLDSREARSWSFIAECLAGER